MNLCLLPSPCRSLHCCDPQSLHLCTRLCLLAEAHTSYFLSAALMHCCTLSRDIRKQSCARCSTPVLSPAAISDGDLLWAWYKLEDTERAYMTASGMIVRAYTRCQLFGDLTPATVPEPPPLSQRPPLPSFQGNITDGTGVRYMASDFDYVNITELYSDSEPDFSGFVTLGSMVVEFADRRGLPPLQQRPPLRASGNDVSGRNAGGANLVMCDASAPFGVAFVSANGTAEPLVFQASVEASNRDRGCGGCATGTSRDAQPGCWNRWSCRKTRRCWNRCSTGYCRWRCRHRTRHGRYCRRCWAAQG